MHTSQRHTRSGGWGWGLATPRDVPLIPRAVVLPRPPQHLQVPTQSGQAHVHGSHVQSSSRVQISTSRCPLPAACAQRPRVPWAPVLPPAPISALQVPAISSPDARPRVPRAFVHPRPPQHMQTPAPSGGSSQICVTHGQPLALAQVSRSTDVLPKLVCHHPSTRSQHHRPRPRARQIGGRHHRPARAPRLREQGAVDGVQMPQHLLHNEVLSGSNLSIYWSHHVPLLMCAPVHCVVQSPRRAASESASAHCTGTLCDPEPPPPPLGVGHRPLTVAHSATKVCTGPLLRCAPVRY